MVNIGEQRETERIIRSWKAGEISKSEAVSQLSDVRRVFRTEKYRSGLSKTEAEQMAGMSPSFRASYLKGKAERLRAEQQRIKAEFGSKRIAEAAEQARLEAERKRQATIEFRSRQLDKPSGASIIPYKPFTKEEISESRRLKGVRYYYDKAFGWVKKQTEVIPSFSFVGEYKAPPVIEKEVVVTGTRGGTIQTKPPTTEELEERGYYEETAERKLTYDQITTQINLDLISEQKASEIADDLRNSTQANINSKVNQIQGDINSGKISLDEGKKRLDDYVDLQNKSVQNVFNTRYSSSMKPHISDAEKTLEESSKKIFDETRKKIDRRDLGLKFAGAFLTGAVVGGISILAPPVGFAIAGAYGLQAVTHIPEIKETIKEQPITFGVGLGGFISGGLVGAGLTKFGKTKYKEYKVNQALTSSRVKITFDKALTTSKQIDALKISQAQKLELIRQLKGEVSIKHIKTKLVSDTGSPKYLPDVKGEFFELTSSTGASLGRITVGYVVSASSKKIFTDLVINQAVGKVKGGGAYLYGRTFIGKEAGRYDLLTGKIRPRYKGKIYTLAERAKLLKQAKKGKIELGLSEFEVRMLGDPTKFKGEKIPSLLGFAETYVLLRGKTALMDAFKKASPYMQGQIFSIQKIVSATGKIKYVLKYTQTGETIIVTESFFLKYGKGLGYAERIRIIEPPKISKGARLEWDFAKEVKVKPIKYDPPKPFKNGRVSQLTNIEKMKIYGDIQKAKFGQGGVPAFATYESAFFPPSSAFGIGTGLITGLGTGLITGLGAVDITKTKDRLTRDTELRLRSDLGLIQPSITKTGLTARQAQALAQPQLQIQKQKLITEEMLRQAPQQLQPQLQVPKLKIPKIIKVLKIAIEKKPTITPPTPQGYNVFGKQVKTQKFMKLNKVPLSKSNAENLGSYLVDHSLARTFKYKLAGKPAQAPKLDIPQNYFRNQRYKFRGFRIVKGQRKPMKDKFIENKFHLLDTKSEVSDIHLRKALSNLQTQSSKRRKALKPRRRKVLTLKDLQKRQPQKPIKQEDLFAPIEFPSVF